MERENTGCFTWIIRFKQSCSERWARIRNRLRRRFYARRGQTIDPSTIVNETGARDMVISKTSYKANKVLPESLASPRAAEKECTGDVVCEQGTDVDECFEKLVKEYVSGIIAKAANTLRMENQALLGNRNVIIEKSADNVSLSPKIANTAVTESLSNILLEPNINQSAMHKTIKDFMVQKSLELLAEKLMTANLLSDYNN